jgi:hypothetical protein
MVEYTCEKCNKVFNRKSNYEVHLNKKIDCSKNKIDVNNLLLNSSTNIPPINEIYPPINETHPPISTDTPPAIKDDDNNHNKCINCNKQFSRSDSYKRHMLFRCKFVNADTKININKSSIGNNNNDVLEILIKIQENQKQIEDEHKKEIIELKNTINDLQSKIKTDIPVSTNINSNNTTNNTTNITNNIKIIRFGAENPADKLTAKEVQYIFGCHKNSMLLRSIEVTHFSNKHPEFHNVYIPDKKMQNAIIFNGIKPDLKSVDYVMDELLLNHVNNLDDMKKREDVMITEHKHIEIDDIVDNFRNYRDTGSDKEKRIYKKAEKEIKEMLYNNKDKVIETHKRAKKRKT